MKFRVFRFNPDEDKKPCFKSYDVPVKPGMTVLDGLWHILEKLDGSIAFRSSCRAGVCGSCAMHINGTYRLACETQLKDLKENEVVIRPLSELKVIKDLVVDMEPFWKKYKYIKPYLMPATAEPDKERLQTQEERRRLDGLIECILCGCCSFSCPVSGTDEEYSGPAAFIQANRFVRDSRDNGGRERLALVDGEDGVWRCHTVFNCTRVCPKDIDPAGSIANLKRKSFGGER